jgi:hypothetical protein
MADRAAEPVRLLPGEASPRRWYANGAHVVKCRPARVCRAGRFDRREVDGGARADRKFARQPLPDAFLAAVTCVMAELDRKSLAGPPWNQP